MGTELLSLYKTRVKHTWKVAFFTTFVACLLIHFYKFTNFLPNHDAFYNVYSTQDITGSGRWFLRYACGISSYFDLPWVNGVLCAVYLGLTTAVITELFNLKNPVVIALSGIVLAASPCTTETLFFGYTADGYMLGLLFSALSAYFSCKEHAWWRYLLSSVLLCLSLAVYQAYLSFAMVLCIVFLVNALLRDETDLAKAFRWILRHAVIYAAAAAVYYLIWQLAMAVKEIEPVEYQGISTIGRISLPTILLGIKKSIINLVLFFVEWNILEHPATLYAILNVVFLLSFAGILLLALYKSGALRRPAKAAFILLCLAACVPVISVWALLSDTVLYRPMMLHSICVLFIFALMLFDEWAPKKIGTVFAVFMLLVVYNFGLIANIAYFYLDKCEERSHYVGSSMMSQAESFINDADSVDTIAFVGERGQDVYLVDDPNVDKIHIFLPMLESDLLYDHSHAYLYLKHTFGLELPEASAEQISILENTDQVRDMPVWPQDGSVQIIDGCLVFKLGE